MAFVSAESFLSYPETNVFDFKPHPLNLTPPNTKEAELDTPEFRAAALAQAQRIGVNPLHRSNGSNPLSVSSSIIEMHDSVFTSTQSIPDLPKLHLEDSELVFLEHINKGGNIPTLVARMGHERCLLKVFSEQDIYTVNGERIPRFESERTAYARLLASGICAEGLVPNCYGWMELSYNQEVSLRQVTGLLDPPHDTRHKALVLEYFPDAAPLSIDNISIYIAEDALYNLCRIHSALVQHGDIACCNCLLLPDKRVVWIDFDHCRHPATGLRRSDLWGELCITWSLLYDMLLPNQRIGYRDLLLR